MDKSENNQEELPKKVEQVEQTESIAIEDVTTEKLKATAFDIDQKVRVLNNQYQTILNELQRRSS